MLRNRKRRLLRSRQDQNVAKSATGHVGKGTTAPGKRADVDLSMENREGQRGKEIRTATSTRRDKWWPVTERDQQSCPGGEGGEKAGKDTQGSHADAKRNGAYLAEPSAKINVNAKVPDSKKGLKIKGKESFLRERGSIPEKMHGILQMRQGNGKLQRAEQT